MLEHFNGSLIKYVNDDRNMICRMSAGIRQSADDGFDYTTYHGGLGARLRSQPDGSLSHAL